MQHGPLDHHGSIPMCAAIWHPVPMRDNWDRLLLPPRFAQHGVMPKFGIILIRLAPKLLQALRSLTHQVMQMLAVMII